MSDKKKDSGVFDVDEFIDHIEKEKTVEKDDSKEEGNHKEKENLLVEAIDDLDKELVELRGEKETVEKMFGEIKEDVDSAHNEELDLRKKVAKLVEKENELNKKKDKLQEQLSKIQKKISKVSNIKKELKDV